MGIDEPNFLKILLVFLKKAETKIIEVDKETCIQTIIKEYICTPSEEPLVIYDLLHGTVVSHTGTVSSAGITNNDVLVINPQLLLDETQFIISTVESIENAINQVRKFDHFSHIPKVFRCKMSNQEFEKTIQEATKMLGNDKGIFGGRKLLMDLMRTANYYYQKKNIDIQQNLIPQVIHLMMGAIGNRLHKSVKTRETAVNATNGQSKDSTYTSSLPNELITHPQHDFLSKIVNYKFLEENSYHILCNAAALHIEPTFQNPVYLSELIATGEIEVGKILIDTSFEVIANGIEI